MPIRLAHHRLSWLVVIAVGLAMVAGLYWFQPWRLVTDTVVADAVPVLAPPGPGSAASPEATDRRPTDASGPTATSTPADAASPTAASSPGGDTASRPDGDTAGTPGGGNRLLAAGTFVTHEHDTSGTAQLVRLADGRRQLVLRGLSTSDGPDLRVWLSDQPVKRGTAGWRVFDDGAYHEVARLRGNRGDQVYPLPDGVDLADFRSVSIWCKRFAVSFGAAELAPA